MYKIPVSIILPKNIDSISSTCDLWYIPYCPIEIKDQEEWYHQIVSFINNYSDNYNIVYIPDSIYNIKTESRCYREHKKDNVFVVGIEKNNTFEQLETAIPDGYHVAHCLQRGISLRKNNNMNDEKIQEMLFDYAVRMMFYFMFIIVTTVWLLGKY